LISGFDWLAAWVASTGSATEETWWLSLSKPPEHRNRGC